MRLIFLLLSLFIVFSCQKNNKKTLVKASSECLTIKYCHEFENEYNACLSNLSCSNFIELFRKLSSDKSCSYKNSSSLELITALSKCDEGKSYEEQVGIKAKVLVNELIVSNQEMLNFFISKEFRESLSGESSQSYKDKSLALEKYYQGGALSVGETYTLDNKNKINLILDKKRLEQTDWTLILSYLTVKIPQTLAANLIPSYDNIAMLIIDARDSFLIKSYMNFILSTQASADEGRSFGLARIYKFLPQRFLDVLSLFNTDARQLIVKSLAFGIINIEPKINKKITKDELKKILPSDKKVYKEKFKHDLLIKMIIEEILAMAKRV